MMHTSTAPVSAPSYTEKAQTHKAGSVLLSIADDRIHKLNGVGALTWMVLEDYPVGLSVDEVARELREQFEAINAEGELRYEVSQEQLRNDTAHFLKKMSDMNLLRIETDSHGQQFYCINEGVSGTTSSTVATVAEAKCGEMVSHETSPFASAEGDIRLSKRETFIAFIGLLAFDFLLTFGGFQSLIKKVQHWPTAEPRTTDPEICRRVRAMVDRAQMYYPKKAMCLQHSAVLTCLLRRRGVPAEMVLAAQEFPPKAHAWVEVLNEVVNDSGEVKEKYHEFRRL